MTEIAPSITKIKARSISSISKDLKKMNISPDDYRQVLDAGFSGSPHRGRMIVKGLLKAKPEFQDKHRILMSPQETRRFKTAP